MNTHTSKIDRFTIFGLAALLLGFTAYLIWALPQNAPAWIGALSWIFTAVGIGLALIGFSRTFGALTTGILTFSTGTVLVGAAYLVFKPLFERIIFVGARTVEPHDFWGLTEISSGMLGILCLIVGSIMAVTTYLRRMLVAVETIAGTNK